MNRKILGWIIAAVMAVMLIVPAALAEEVAVSVDPFEEIVAEYLQAKSVEPYQVAVHPPRVTGWGALRWAPSSSAPVMATYTARQELTVLKETPNWLQVENKETGDVGFISRASVAEPGNVPVRQDLVPTFAENGKADLGVIDINGAFSLQCRLAEGYSIRQVRSSSDQLVALITSEDPQKPLLQLSVAYDEAYADVDRMNDLDDDALAVLEKTFTDANPTVEISYTDTGLGTRLMMVRQRDNLVDFLDFLSVYKGYFVECVMVPSVQDGVTALTDDQVAMCVDFLTNLDFVPAVATGGSISLAGLNFITNLTDYDAEANTVKATVMYGPTVPAAEAEALAVGGRLKAGELLDEEITSLETTDEGDILINDLYDLRKYGDEYHIYLYEIEYLEPYVVRTLEIPDTLTVEDNISKETGEPLEEPVFYTAEEFRAMLAAETYPDFATDNTRVYFGENEEMISVVREYSPAQ